MAETVVAPRVPVLIVVAETVVTEIAGVWILDVAEIVVALKLVTESVGVWIDVAVTVPAVMFVAESATV